MIFPNTAIISYLHFVTSFAQNYNYSTFSDPNPIFLSQLYSTTILTSATKTDQTWPTFSVNAFVIWAAHSESFKFQKNQALPNVVDRLEQYE